MDPLSSSSTEVPHIIQVYQPTGNDAKLQNPQIIHIAAGNGGGKLRYDSAMGSELHLPSGELAASAHVSRQLVMSCAQTHLQAMPTLQTQMLHSTEMNQALQFTSHVLLPPVPVFKQQMLIEGQQFYGQYDTYVKEPSCIVTKLEHEGTVVKEVEKQTETRPECTTQSDLTTTKKIRSQEPNPTSWACNVRKIKHQRGEAYISRRGKYVPERTVKNIKNCLTSCKYKCSERINDTDRELIFKAFYSLSVNEKKHFLLNTTERNLIKSHKHISNVYSRRKYAFKYFFLVRATRFTVCKNFYLGTLAISQKPVYNVHMSKSDMNIPKPDGRGHSQNSTHALPSEVKESVRKHIMSFKTVEMKAIKQFSRKKQYLDPSLNVKQMHLMYTSECNRNNEEPVKESMYRKIFRKEFNLHFKKIKTEQQQVCCKCKGPVKKT